MKKIKKPNSTEIMAQMVGEVCDVMFNYWLDHDEIHGHEGAGFASNSVPKLYDDSLKLKKKLRE